MALADSCSACGCAVTNGKTPAGPALLHNGKTYCAECAAMILSPEAIAEIVQQANKPATVLPKAALLSSEDDLIGEVESPAAKVAAGPASAKSNVAKASATQSPSVSASRRGTSVTAVKGKRPTATANVKPERDEKGGRETGRVKKRQADNMGLYIGIGVGVLALVVGGYFAFGGSGKKAVAHKKAPVLTDDDKTTSTEYARMADAALEKNDKRAAIQYFSKAANKAEKEGNVDQAKSYNMKSMDLTKGSKLKD